MAFYTCIHYSETIDRYYVGSCEDIKDRLSRHNAKYSKSTKAGAPWELKYTEFFETRSDAVTRELEIKNKKSRKYIEWLISTAG
ncbi:GIY-YIG nuclease family protein [Pontibacter fetidus]|uniref:GIY-YIG nuclease family protein n=1 Tax=Pontibacter fetidus TaxID=2700082 RepID=A0A6B2GZ83_9BACT|nr:GIY-YIG nuclease family protein [Pontibacter fetidus]NDK55138.1 GIY-YIG nuclease family protein [Pontibacter fetidus]